MLLYFVTIQIIHSVYIYFRKRDSGRPRCSQVEQKVIVYCVSEQHTIQCEKSPFPYSNAMRISTFCTLHFVDERSDAGPSRWQQIAPSLAHSCRCTPLDWRSTQSPTPTRRLNSRARNSSGASKFHKNVANFSL